MSRFTEPPDPPAAPLHVRRYGVGDVKAVRVASTRRIIPAVEAATEDAWRSLSRTRPGVTLFDGSMCRLERWKAVGGVLRIEWSLTSYKVFLGTNLRDAEGLVTSHGRDVLASPLGVSTLLRTVDDRLLLGRRNERVAYYPHRVHPFAGAVEPGPNGTVDVFDDVSRELHEEVGLTRADVSDFVCLGLVEDSRLIHPELICLAHTPLNAREVEVRLDKGEHGQIVMLAADVARARRMASEAELTPVAKAALRLWASDQS